MLNGTAMSFIFKGETPLSSEEEEEEEPSLVDSFSSQTKALESTTFIILYSPHCLLYGRWQLASSIFHTCDLTSLTKVSSN